MLGVTGAGLGKPVVPSEETAPGWNAWKDNPPENGMEKRENIPIPSILEDNKSSIANASGRKLKFSCHSQ